MQTSNDYSKSACNSYLNNAIELLLMEKVNKQTIKEAIAEICFCIDKAGGSYTERNEKKLLKRGFLLYQK